jgi:protein-S-isoprenylcysteine O-methyltransferase Ste14
MGAHAFAMWSKARTEERFLVEELGSAYEEYRQQVPMLVPIRR